MFLYTYIFILFPKHMLLLEQKWYLPKFFIIYHFSYSYVRHINILSSIKTIQSKTIRLFCRHLLKVLVENGGKCDVRRIRIRNAQKYIKNLLGRKANVDMLDG